MFNYAVLLQNQYQMFSCYNISYFSPQSVHMCIIHIVKYTNMVNVNFIIKAIFI